MRVTRIAGDFNDIGDKPCRVYLNETEILDWTVADDLRRVVEMPAGPRFGSVRIDMAGAVPAAVPEPAPVPSNSLSGMFVPEQKPAAPAIEVIEAPAAEPVPAPAAPTYAAPKVAVKPAAARKKRGR